MSPEVAKYCKRAIIDYLAGNMDEFRRLTSIAMAMNKQVYTCECGEVLIEGDLRHGKDKDKILLCTRCGQVYKEGEKLMRIRGKRLC